MRWYSTTHTFVVVSVVKGKELPRSPSAPATPFAAAFAKVAASEVISSEVPSIDGEVVQRYKVTFNITGVGNVDPDTDLFDVTQSIDSM